MKLSFFLQSYHGFVGLRLCLYFSLQSLLLLAGLAVGDGQWRPAGLHQIVGGATRRSPRRKDGRSTWTRRRSLDLWPGGLHLSNLPVTTNKKAEKRQADKHHAGAFLRCFCLSSGIRRLV